MKKTFPDRTCRNKINIVFYCEETNSASDIPIKTIDKSVSGSGTY